jgi:hypothetical protein
MLKSELHNIQKNPGVVMSTPSASDTSPANAYECMCSAAFAAASIAVDDEVVRKTAITVARFANVLGQPKAEALASIDFESALEMAA